MPGFTPANGDLIQVRTVCYTPQQISMNVLHYQIVTQGGTPMDLGRMALAFDTLWHTLYKTLIPTTARWRGVGCQNMMAPKTLEYSSTVNSDPGTAGDNLTPTQVSGLIHLRAPLAGRRYRGRIYPGLLGTILIADLGGLTVGGVTELTALADALGPVLNLAQDGQTCQVALTIRHPDVVVGGVKVPQWSTVDLISASVLLATQKRRGEYGQHNSVPW